MNSLNTLYFPGTDIYSIRQYPLFLLFQNLHIIQPVEDGPGGDESSDSFIKSEFCQVHTPCPLGPDRQRFLHLLSDIKNRKDDYAAQLSTLLLASRSTKPSTGEDSERAIIDSLFTPQDLQSDKKDAAHTEKLWQARLVLCIGEVLDQEEEEIAANLSILEDDQAGLFHALHGDEMVPEEDNPFSELTAFENNLTATNPSQLKRRFNGWKTLFLEAEIDAPEILLTSSRDSGDILLEAYQEIANKPAPLIAALPLPGLLGLNAQETVQTVKNFSKQNSEVLSRLQVVFKELAHLASLTDTNNKKEDALKRVAKDWQDQLETAFPKDSYGRVQLNCYLFPGYSCSKIIGKKLNSGSEPKNGLLMMLG